MATTIFDGTDFARGVVERSCETDMNTGKTICTEVARPDTPKTMTTEARLHAECKRLEAALGECRANNEALRAGCARDWS